MNEKYNNNNNINRNKIKLKPLLSTNDKKGSNKEDEQNYTKEFKKVIQFLKLPVTYRFIRLNLWNMDMIQSMQ